MDEIQTDYTKFPQERAFLQTLGRLLRARDLVAAADLLAVGTADISLDNYDNWNGGTYTWAINIRVPVDTYAKAVPTAGGKALDQVREVICACANEMMADKPNDGFGGVSIIPTIGADPRDVPGVNNQGRAHSNNVAGIVVDGLRFRSRGEVNLYRALRRLGVTFAPLPVFLGKRRIEPDFVIIKDGVVMVVEIDGPGTHSETPVEAEQRLAMFRHEGARTESA